MLATKQLLEDQGAASVTLSSRYDDRLEYRAHGVNVVAEIVPFPAVGTRFVRTVRLVLGMFASVTVIAASQLGRRVGRAALRVLMPHVFRILKDVDTVVIAGGGYMYSSKRRLNFSLYQSLVSIRLGHAAVGATLMMPQSIGPVTREIDRRLIEWSLKYTTPVVRERLSLAASARMPRLNAREVDDVAFYRQSSGSSAQVREVCRIVVMDWRWSTSSDDAAFEAYVQALVDVATGVHALGLEVVLGGHSSIPEHKQDDLLVARLISARLRVPHLVDTNTDVAHLYQAYAATRVVIGTRLHACIMAVSVGTPAISLQYQEKSSGVLGRLGMQDLVHRVDAIDSALLIRQVREVAQTRRRCSGLAERVRVRIASAYEGIHA